MVHAADGYYGGKWYDGIEVRAIFSQTAPRSNRKALCVFEIGRRNKAGVAKNCQNHLQNPKRKRASSSSSGSDSDSAPIQRQQRAAQGNKLTQQGKKALFIIKNPLFC